MNYGFEPTKFDDKLAAELGVMLQGFWADEYGHKAYVESNGMYSGVRIRRITHYTEAQIDLMVKQAEEIYNKLQMKCQQEIV